MVRTYIYTVLLTLLAAVALNSCVDEQQPSADSLKSDSLMNAVYGEAEKDVDESMGNELLANDSTSTRRASYKSSYAYSRQRFIGTVVALVLVICAFLLVIYFRHQAAMRLETAYYNLELANERAEESSRMKSNFIQQISHEIRTPLNILSGFTQLITTPGMEMDDETKVDVNRQIKENTDRITRLVNKMLELSDTKSSAVIERRDNVPVALVASDAAEKSGISNASHLDFEIQLTPESEEARLLTNRRFAVRALTLVLGNARKFTAPAEGLPKQKQHATLRLSVENKRVLYTVEDTGIGVPASEAEHIFDEFVQLDSFYEGTGIGLTVARSLARRLGGDLWLDTTYINGARFVMALPMDDAVEQPIVVEA